MYGQFVLEFLEEIDKDLYWKWSVQNDLKLQITEQKKPLTLFRMGFFGAAHRWGGAGGKKAPTP